MSIPDPDVVIPESSEGSSGDFTPAFTQYVQAQPQSDFVKMLLAMFEILLQFLRALQSQHSLIIEILREERFVVFDGSSTYLTFCIK
jgi:hypothetical protein